MLRLNDDPRLAEQEMQAVIFYLTTFGYIDGEFDAAEKRFVRDYIARLVEARVARAKPDADEALRRELTGKFVAHFHEVFEATDRQIEDLLGEVVARDEDTGAFLRSRLKLRCFEIFQSFDEGSRSALLATIDELIHADGQVHPEETRFRDELLALLRTPAGAGGARGAGGDSDDDQGGRNGSAGNGAGGDHALELHRPTDRPPPGEAGASPFFDALEWHYSRDPVEILRQLATDREIIDEALDHLDDQRRRGRGRLAGARTIEDLVDESPFLDGHVYWCPPRPDPGYDVTVLGDLHGCYSCLKAAVLQARFFEKLDAWRLDPDAHPEPRLVFLGDYIDRGLFSLNGVLRTVLQIFCAAPNHVHVLRGNHEYFLEHRGEVFGGVKPSESIDRLKPHVSVEVFRHYIALFEAMPNMLLLDRTLFVHGGIPRDQLVSERWDGLATLDDPEVRFQMMWSDPSAADHVPGELQGQSARFAFGRLQAAAFLRRIGCRALVRGHEKVEEGFRLVYDDPDVQLFTLFSAGGADNNDLPPASSYRRVTPMALTIRARGRAPAQVSPWPIAYQAFNDPERNRFFDAAPDRDLVPSLLPPRPG